MVKLIFKLLFIFLLVVSVSGTGVFGNDKTTESSSVIRVKDDTLTVKVEDIPLTKVLTEVADQMSIEISFFIPGEEPVVADFTGLPVEEGLRQLLRDYNYAFAYGPEDTKNGERNISKVFILSRKKGRQDRPGALVSFGIKPRFSGETSLETLIKALKDKDPYIREDAVDAIGALKDERNLGIMVDVLHTDEDEYVRMAAADALGFLRSEEAIASLAEALKDESVEVKVSIADALGVIRSEDAIEPLMAAIQDEDEEVRESAIAALGRIGGDRAGREHKHALAEEVERRRREDAELIELTKRALKEGSNKSFGIGR